MEKLIMAHAKDREQKNLRCSSNQNFLAKQGTLWSNIIMYANTGILQPKKIGTIRVELIVTV